MSVRDRIALVTGATKGIGLAIARDLAAEGATVLLNYRSDTERAEQALRQVAAVGPKAELIQADVADPDAVAAMFRRIRTDHGRLDLLVNNAGITADGYALMLGDAKWQRVIGTDLTGAFLCCRAAGRLMVRQRGGAIVVVSSTSAVNAPAGQANYAAAKAGLQAMVRVLAKEFGEHGVRVNAVLPGFVDTAMTRGMPGDQLTNYLAHVPLGRIGRPEDVAAPVRFLLDDEQSAYVTGASLLIDGGLTA
ncbi:MULTISPECIES: SDR family NAD(P)-dependent oxidoreductase [unclassified Nocardia]|uniref:SDR family NAD(P)-dependent oxidoreductase n=1 Tax=unclassified Nocardia TaxID=2637762 RepID=UPI001CE44292|nr:MULTISPECIES: 3-oxoacyl-ACP reductase FabG [unclassified Nocardia]